MKLQYTKTHPDACISAPQKPGDAGYDLHIVEDVVIGFDTKMIDSHIAVAIPEGYVGLMFLRSSAGIKKHLRLANGVGVIDSTYRGPMKFALYYQPQVGEYGDMTTSLNCKLQKGDRICQLVIVPYASLQLEEVTKLPETIRGECGIGSTGN